MTQWKELDLDFTSPLDFYCWGLCVRTTPGAIILLVCDCIVAGQSHQVVMSDNSSSANGNSWTILTPEVKEHGVERVGPLAEGQGGQVCSEPAQLVMEQTDLKDHSHRSAVTDGLAEQNNAPDAPQVTPLENSEDAAVPHAFHMKEPTLGATPVENLTCLTSDPEQQGASAGHSESEPFLGPDTDSFSDSYTHISPPPESTLHPAASRDREGLSEGEESSELRKTLREEAKQEVEVLEEKGNEGDGVRRRKVSLLTPVDHRDDDEEEEGEEEPFRPPQREDDVGFSLNKCIFGAVILLGLGTIFFSGVFMDLDDESDTDVKELKNPELQKEWLNLQSSRDTPAGVQPPEILERLAEKSQKIAVLQAQLQEQEGELKAAQLQVEEGNKERMRREELEVENQRMKGELDKLPALQKELEQESERVKKEGENAQKDREALPAMQKELELLRAKVTELAHTTDGAQAVTPLSASASPSAGHKKELPAIQGRTALKDKKSQDEDFEALLLAYLTKLIAPEERASKKEELNKLLGEFFTNGVFVHGQIPFSEFVEDVAEILEDMAEGEEDEELEDEMEGFAKSLEVLGNPEKVYINYNGISKLRYLKRLKLINLNFSNHTNPDMTFWNLKLLRILVLYNCRLSFLTKRMFRDLQSLELLRLHSVSPLILHDGMFDVLPALREVVLDRVDFRCDCENGWLLEWAESSRQVQVLYMQHQQCILQYEKWNFLATMEKLCQTGVQYLCYLGTASTITLLVSASVSYRFAYWPCVVLFFRLRGYVERKIGRRIRKRRRARQEEDYLEEEAEMKYDAFVSFSSHDEAWVFGELAPRLEEQGQPRLRLCLHNRDFEVGKGIVDNIAESIYSSRRTVCVLTRRYLRSDWCGLEMRMATHRLLEEQKHRLILIFLEHISPFELSAFHRLAKLVKSHTYLDWPQDESERIHFWERLRRNIAAEGRDI
ncbi:hypothetical protein SRHO_G00060070 [Serrasalmus rhombeus]